MFSSSSTWILLLTCGDLNVSIAPYDVAVGSMRVASAVVRNSAINDQFYIFALLNIFHFAKNGDNFGRFLQYFVLCLIRSVPWRKYFHLLMQH